MLLLTFVACSDYQSNPDIKRENLNGKVKSIETITYRISNDTVKEQSVISHEKVYFDKNGYFSEIYKYNNITDSLETKLVYMYTTESKCITEYNAQNALVGQYTYVYKDSIGKYIHDYIGKMEDVYIEFYDKEGYIKEKHTFDYKGNKEWKYSYLYDENGNLKETVNYDYETEYMRWKITYTYDDNGFIQEKYRYDYDNNLRWKIAYSYDKHGNVTEEKISFPDGSQNTNKFSYKYDTKGNWIEKTIGKSNESQESTFSIRKIEYY